MTDQHSAAVLEEFSRKFNIENSRYKRPKLLLPAGCLAVLLFVLAPLALILFIVGFFFPPVWLLFLCTGLAGGLILYLIYSYKASLATYEKVEILKQDFKSKVLPLLCKSIYSDVNYSYNNKVSEKYLTDSALFSTKFFESTKTIQGEDFFQGAHDGVRFEFSEITHYVDGLTVKGGALLTFVIAVSVWLNIDFTDLFKASSFTSVKNNFRGLFLYADFNKSFSGEVMIETKASNIFDMAFQRHSLEPIMVENQKINDLYSIKCSNPQIGYYVMSSQLIDAIDNITSLMGTTLKMSIKNGNLYLIVPLESNFFESQAIVDGEITLNSLEKMRKELSVIKNLLDALNLNNRIWTKQ